MFSKEAKVSHASSQEICGHDSQHLMEVCRIRPSGPAGLCLFLVIGCAGVLDLFVARSMSTTYDELPSVSYGEQILHGRPDRSDPLVNSKAPVAALNALPRVLAGYLNSEATPSLLRILRSMRCSRLASVLAALLLNIFVYRWVYALYGDRKSTRLNSSHIP